MKKFLFAFFVFLYLFLFSPSAWAAKDFDTSYISSYTVSADGLTSVDQEIDIKNNLADVFVSQYSLTIGSNQVKYINVWDDYGPIEPQVNSGVNKTTIQIKFNSNSVGKGKTNHLHIAYQTTDFATINGQILEVNIPALAKSEELIDYQVNLNIPSQFGPPSFIQPQPRAKKVLGNQIIYFFDKASLLKNEGLSAAFGESQIYDFSLTYELKNPNTFYGRAQIALPPDTAYQQVAYQTIEPAPEQFEVDQDGNWLAYYRLSPGQRLTIDATGSAQVYIRPQEKLKEKPLTKEQLQQYLKPQKYWEVNDPEIKKIANELKSPKQIYDYVVSNLIYDYGRLEKAPQRVGAKWILSHKESALCTEFADLFIALARTAGIPARKIDGFAYTTNVRLRPLSSTQDVLHAWPEYYDTNKNVWIPVDPTWGNTTYGVDFFNKLDLNHFTFVRQGIKSDSPLPAGAYRFDQGTVQTQKNVLVKFGVKKDLVKQVDFKPQLPNLVIGGLPIMGNVTVFNSGQLAYHQPTLWLKAAGSSQEFEIDMLIPKSNYRIPVQVKTSWNKATVYNIEVGFDQRQITYQIQVLPFYQYFVQRIQLWLQQLIRH